MATNNLENNNLENNNLENNNLENNNSINNNDNKSLIMKEKTSNLNDVKKKQGKKRGRKPKIKSEEDNVEKMPKKRGRKPKIKLISEEEKNKFVLPSKRGRKPKDKMKIMDKLSNIKDISNTILHLPIPINILNNIEEDINIINPLNTINPYDPHLLNNNIDKTNNNCIYSEIKEIALYNNKNDYEINNKVNEEKKNNKDSNLNLNYYNYVKTYSNIQKSYVKCNWCLSDCEKNNIYKLPYEINNNIIKYYGNFCCPECAVAFNFNELDDEYIWERYSLLNYLYNDNDIKLNIAPSRLLLDIFGGPLCIDEFKNIIASKKHVNIIFPPHFIICPQIEVQKNTDNNLFVPLNINRVNKYTHDLKLKRDKPINNINTLENCMNLKCI